MSWADDMTTHAEYFCKKFDEGDDWFYPDHLESQANFPYAKQGVRAVFGELGSFMDPGPSLSSVDRMLADIGKAMDEIDKDQVGAILNDVDLYLENWEGDTANGFRAYLRGDPGVQLAAARMYDGIRAAKFAMQAYRKVIESFQADVNAMVERAQEAVKSAEARETAIDLTLVTAAVSIGVIAAGAATSGVFLATAGVAGALQAGGAGVTQLMLEGSTKEEVIDGLPEKGNLIMWTARRELEKVETAFKKVSEHLTGAEAGRVVPKRPGLITDSRFDPDGFHQEGKAPPGGISHTDLVAG